MHYNNTCHSLYSSAPSTVEASNTVISDSSFVVTWDVPSAPNGIVTGYDVSVYNKRTGYDRSFMVPADQDLRITLNDLCEFMKCVYSVFVQLGGGSGGQNGFLGVVHHLGYIYMYIVPKEC